MKSGMILFTDLDGTLLRDDKSVSKENQQAVKSALNAGNYVVVATGRPVESGRMVVRELGLTMPGCYMIAFNGGVLYDCAADRVLYDRTIPIQYVYQLFDRAHSAGIYVQTYNKTDILTEHHTRELDYYISKTKMTYKTLSDVGMGLNEEPNKVLMIYLDGREKLERFQKDNAAWERGKVSSFFSSDKYLEYCPYGVSKGSGVEYLCRFLNIPIEHSVAVGDEKNDISMIKSAHYGVAMKNAVKEAKDAAVYVTKNDNNNNAIAEVITRFML